MIAAFAALALLALQDPADGNTPFAAPPPAAAAPAEPAEAPYPAGAPKDDYGLVAWCYGALRGWLDLHDTAMPEVTRIETAFRRPGSNLAADLKVYEDMQKDGKKDLARFAKAIEAAERASIRPISAQGAEAVKKGRNIWAAAPNMPKARLAQEWMSWTLPARCETTADALEARARLMGRAFQVNAAPEPAAPAAQP